MAQSSSSQPQGGPPSSSRATVTRVAPRRHVANLLSAAAFQLVAVVAPLLILSLTARNYTLGEFGRYSIALAFASLAANSLAFGVGHAVCFRIAETDRQLLRRQDGILQSGLLLLLLLIGVSIPVILLCVYLLQYDAQTTRLLGPLLLGYWSIALTEIMNAAFRGRREMSWPLAPAIAVAISTVLFIAPQLLAGYPLERIAGYWAAAQLLGALVAVLCLRRVGLLRRCNQIGACWRETVVRSLAVGADTLVYRFGTQIVVVILPVLLTVEECGLYTAAAKPLVLLGVGNQFVAQFFGPYIATVRFTDPQRVVQRIQLCHKIAFFFTGSVFVVALAFPHEFCRLLFGESGDAVAPYFRVLALASIVYHSPPYTAPLKALGLERQVLWCGVVQFSTMFASLLLFTPVWGLWGAVGATFAAYLSYWTSAAFLYRRNGLAPVHQPARYVAYLALSCCCGLLLQWMPDVRVAFVGFAASVAIVSAAVYWSQAEWTFAWSLFRRSLLTRPHGAA